ncbi:MAG: hypothetical protein GXY86_10475 [Firmicutes bacterium]|nr:hypothetical protein [Bacillota bacterium]
MSFGSLTIYPFPAVQYIPLPVATISQGPIPNLNFKTASPLIITSKELKQWQNKLIQEFGLDISRVWSSDSFPILGLNCLVEEVKYRSYFVTMVGKAVSDYYHYFYIPKRYLYKKKLFFELYDRDSAKKIARYSLFMQESIG